jgi:predicted RNA-binding Zn ribbon-like protein
MDIDTERELLLDFLATRTIEGDRLATPDELLAWLLERGLLAPDDAVTIDDVRRVRHVRAAIRALFSAGGGAIDARTVATLTAATREAPLRIEVTDDGAVQLTPVADGVPGVLARFVSTIYRASIDGTLARYKACGCGDAFYDTTKNRSRVWCDMATCGSVSKARAYRGRKRVAER